MIVRLNGLRYVEDVALNNNMVHVALSIEQASSQAPHRLTMLEGTYIFVGTEGIPLRTWHALPSEAASVTLWPEGKAGQGSNGVSLCASPLWGLRHMCIVSMNWMAMSQPPPPPCSVEHNLCISSPVTIWSTASSALWTKKTAKGKQSTLLQWFPPVNWLCISLYRCAHSLLICAKSKTEWRCKMCNMNLNVKI